MQKGTQVLSIETYPDDPVASNQCNKFLYARQDRYVFGCNEWAKSIAEQIDLDGFVDDFTTETSFCGKPVIRSQELPKTARVISAIVGVRPLTALKHITKISASVIDYFTFQRYSGLALKSVMFLSEFNEEFAINRSRYDWLFRRIKDADSRCILQKLINFRISRDLRYMEGFVDAQDRQYFESFLKLSTNGETFLDVGSYDGNTSKEFIRQCPGYRSIHVFEPDPSNMKNVFIRLGMERNVHYHNYGVSDRHQVLHFASSGSASSVNASGDLLIRVKRIDNVINEPYSFLKMDIEGSEVSALQGASRTIREYHPRLAISVYHKVDDFWRIPELVLSFREDYDIYMRHYTEGVTETVMFFMPKK